MYVREEKGTQLRMLTVYINYPNKRIMIHSSAKCSEIKKQQKPGQRYIKLTVSTITVELKKLVSKKYTFSSNKGANDAWLEVDFGNVSFEIAVVHFIGKILAKNYNGFSGVKPRNHSCK